MNELFFKNKNQHWKKNKTLSCECGQSPMCVPCPMSHTCIKQERGEIPYHSLKYKQQQQWCHHTNMTMKEAQTMGGKGTFKKITMVPNDHNHKRNTNRVKTW
jgi:hypothetical protein